MKNETHPPQPDLSICPKHFCFFWNGIGDYVSKGMHENVEKTMNQMVLVTEAHCGFNMDNAPEMNTVRVCPDLASIISLFFCTLFLTSIFS